MAGSERVARLEVRLDQAVSQQIDQETRIRRLERMRWIATGLAMPLSGLIGAIVAKFIGIA